MPWKTFSENGKMCVYKHDAKGNKVGKTLGCHPDKASADKQMAALYASEPGAAKGAKKPDTVMPANMMPKDMAKEQITGIKAFENDGAKYLWLWTSNAFKDRDGEIIQTKAWENWVDRHDQAGDYGRVWFWHLKGSDFATIENAMVEGRFLVELAKVDDTQYGSKMFHAITHPEEFQNIAPKGWGTSHGYLYQAKDLGPDNVYSRVEKFESTVLPFHVASNLYGGVKEVIDMATPRKDKVKALAALVGSEADVETQLALATEATKALEKAGIAFKEASDPEPEKPVEDVEEETEDVEVESDDQVMEMEVDDALVKEIAKAVDVTSRVKEAMDSVLPVLEAQIQKMVEKAINDNVDKLMGTKEQIAKEVLGGRITLRPYVASQAAGNVVSEGTKEAAQKAKTDKDKRDVVGGVVKLMLSGQ